MKVQVWDVQIVGNELFNLIALNKKKNLACNLKWDKAENIKWILKFSTWHIVYINYF